MGGTRSLTKIGAVFAVVVFTAVAPYKSAYAQTRTVGNFGVGSFHSRPGNAARSCIGRWIRLTDRSYSPCTYVSSRPRVMVGVDAPYSPQLNLEHPAIEAR
jgi:hypothetical protein